MKARAKRVNKSETQLRAEIKDNGLQERQAKFIEAINKAQEEFHLVIELALNYTPDKIEPAIRLKDTLKNEPASTT